MDNTQNTPIFETFQNLLEEEVANQANRNRNNWGAPTREFSNIVNTHFGGKNPATNLNLAYAQATVAYAQILTGNAHPVTTHPIRLIKTIQNHDENGVEATRAIKTSAFLHGVRLFTQAVLDMPIKASPAYLEGKKQRELLKRSAIPA